MKVFAVLAAALVVTLIHVKEGGASDAYAVDPLNRVMKVSQAANVRAGPGPDYAVRVTLAAGVGVRVTGAVQDRDWLRIDLRGDGGAAYIYAPLLKEASAPIRLKSFGPGWSVTENQPCQAWNNGKGRTHEMLSWSGACVGGKASGQGRLIWRSAFGENVYEGTMEAGKLHGIGTLKSSDGSRYRGEWHRGRRHGSGVYTWAIGHRYEGGWRDDKPNGFGTARFADGEVHRGQWLDGCYGERGGDWAALMTSITSCGFE